MILYNFIFASFHLIYHTTYHLFQTSSLFRYTYTGLISKHLFSSTYNSDLYLCFLWTPYIYWTHIWCQNLPQPGFKYKSKINIASKNWYLVKIISNKSWICSFLNRNKRYRVFHLKYFYEMPTFYFIIAKVGLNEPLNNTESVRFRHPCIARSSSFGFSDSLKIRCLTVHCHWWKISLSKLKFGPCIAFWKNKPT